MAQELSGTARDMVKRTLKNRSYCIIATSSADAVPHAVGVLYTYVDNALYIVTGLPTKKARNIHANPKVGVCVPKVGVCVPVKKYPIGPPFAVSFQGAAEILPPDDPEIAALLVAGKLKKITGYGVLNEPGICFIRVTPARKIHTYGLGVPLRTILRSPVHADRAVRTA